MPITHDKVVPLLEYISVDTQSVICYFRCTVTNKTVASVVPFEPFEGKIVITFKDMLLHPVKSYNRYYHTPITIYGNNTHDTLVVKAFKKVSRHFVWNTQKQIYIHN